MSSLQRMVGELSPFGIYSLTEDSNIYCELSAYAVGLDLLRNAQDTLLREGFYATAESYGLSIPEKMWGATRETLQTETRRQMLKERLALSGADFTVASLQKVIGMLGLEARVHESPKTEQISVVVDTKGLTKAERGFIINQLQGHLPAHLDISVSFEGFIWADVDSSLLTFAQMDSSSLTWAEIDIYTL